MKVKNLILKKYGKSQVFFKKPKKHTRVCESGFYFTNERWRSYLLKLFKSNLSYASEEDESSVFDFANALNHINNFKSSLLPKGTEESIHHDFIRVILYKIHQITENKTDLCN